MSTAIDLKKLMDDIGEMTDTLVSISDAEHFETHKKKILYKLWEFEQKILGFKVKQDGIEA